MTIQGCSAEQETYNKLWSEKPLSTFKSTFDEDVLLIFAKHNVKRVLDVGSGDGSNAIFLAKNGFMVTALDFSEVGIRLTEKKAKTENIKIKCALHDMHKRLPFPAGSFDAAYSYQVLNHGTETQLTKTLKEILRVLKKEGILSIKLAVWENIKIKHITGNIYRDMMPEFSDRLYWMTSKQTWTPITGKGAEIGVTHFFFSEKKLIKLLQRIGFKLISISKTKTGIIKLFLIKI
jgi:ubiquinone/menaquinone biosynthesis C-methylase UbiE